MDQKVSEFLSQDHICCLTTTLADGTLHAAALHFSHIESPFEIYVSTEKTSRKCSGLLNAETVKAACVVGFSEEKWVTIQMDGQVKMISDPGELKTVQDIHYKKHPNSEKYKDDPNTVFLKFTPSWWRYTDYNTKPPTHISSE